MTCYNVEIDRVIRKGFEGKIKQRPGLKYRICRPLNQKNNLFDVRMNMVCFMMKPRIILLKLGS